MDRFPKKTCKYCKKAKPDHFPYTCRMNPKVIARQKAGMKRTPIKKIGKYAQLWIDTRAEWIALNPPPIEGKYWECYLHIHEWCPLRIDIEHLTLDHVVPRSNDPAKRYDHDNLRPACEYCNGMKGSRSLDQLVKDLHNDFIQSIKQKADQ